MQQLVGKRVWVTNMYHTPTYDPDKYLCLWCCGVEDGFIALAETQNGEPTLYVNFRSVAEVEVYLGVEKPTVVLDFPLPGGGRAILLRRDSDKPDDPDDGDVN